MTLIILAAGMGSRYGGLKQIDPITENGQFIIDFSVYDALRAGFDKIVFVIKKSNYDDFKNTIGKRFEGRINVEYAFQNIDDLPNGFTVPEGREKPWGTAHAVLAARNYVNEPFAVINADDFYGANAFCKLFEHFKKIGTDDSVSHYCMIGYELDKTLTDNGTVSRGICTVDNAGRLTDIVERTKIYRKDNRAFYELDGESYEIAKSTTVSMNCWGFSPDIFDHIEKGFIKFLNEKGGELKSEYYLPFSVDEMMRDGICDVTVYNTPDVWFGVTYKEDKDKVKRGIAALIDNGTYPEKLN